MLFVGPVFRRASGRTFAVGDALGDFFDLLEAGVCGRSPFVSDVKFGEFLAIEFLGYARQPVQDRLFQMGNMMKIVAQQVRVARSNHRDVEDVAHLQQASAVDQLFQRYFHRMFDVDHRGFAIGLGIVGIDGFAFRRQAGDRGPDYEVNLPFGINEFEMANLDNSMKMIRPGLSPKRIIDCDAFDLASVAHILRE